jgi:hypothetical protein
MLKFRDNLVISALANVESEYTMKEEQDYYEISGIHTVRLIFNFDDTEDFVSIPKHIAVINSEMLGFYYLDTIDFDGLDNCIVEYTDDGCGLFGEKVEELYNLFMMTYSHDDASDGLSEYQVDEYVNMLKKENSND